MMVRMLSDGDVNRVLELPPLLEVVADAFRKQGRDEVERPTRPHFPVGIGLQDSDPMGTGLVMPAYIHGGDYYVCKLVAVHEGNHQRGLPTVNAQIVVTRADTGLPAAIMDGTRVTNARTGCIGGLAVRELAREPVRMGMIGAGTQARWQSRAVAAATDLRSIRVFSPSDSREQCASELSAELDVDVTAVDRPRAAVEDANVVITATTATEPTFPAEAISPGTVVIAIGAYTPDMQELSPTIFARSSRQYADVPSEVVETGDAIAAGLGESDFTPFSSLLLSGAPAVAADEIIVMKSVGTAVLDAATATHLLSKAAAGSVGTKFDLSVSANS